MAVATREHILREIRRLADENGGIPLGKDRFATATGISESAWRGRYWARFGDAVDEAGYQPNTWVSQTLSDDELLQTLAAVARDLGHFPTSSELRLARRTDDRVPSHSIFTRRFGSRAEQLRRLIKFADARPEFADVAELCAPLLTVAATVAGAPEPLKPDPVVTGVVYMIRMGDHFKVGRSNDLDRRTRELRTQLPVREELIHTIETDDPSGIEAYWHRRFAAHRANGEWFTLPPADVAAFQRRTFM